MDNKYEDINMDEDLNFVEISIPAWGEVIQSGGGLVVSDGIDELELLKTDTSEKVSETIQATAKTLEYLEQLSQDTNDADLDFLYDEQSEDILESIFEESRKQERDLEAITGSSKVKATGMTLEMIEELKKVSPGTFSERHRINDVEEKLIEVENENDILGLMVIMTRYQDGSDVEIPNHIEEERRKIQILEEEQRRREMEEIKRRKLEEQRRKALELESQRRKELEDEERRRRQLEEERRRQLEEEERRRQLEEEEERRRQLEEERRRQLEEEEERSKQVEVQSLMQDGGSLVQDGGSLLQDGESLIQVIEELYMYEETLEAVETEIGEFSVDESETYSLKELEKKIIVSEDTIL